MAFTGSVPSTSENLPLFKLSIKLRSFEISLRPDPEPEPVEPVDTVDPVDPEPEDPDPVDPEPVDPEPEEPEEPVVPVEPVVEPTPEPVDPSGDSDIEENEPEIIYEKEIITKTNIEYRIKSNKIKDVTER